MTFREDLNSVIFRNVLDILGAPLPPGIQSDKLRIIGRETWAGTGDYFTEQHTQVLDLSIAAGLLIALNSGIQGSVSPSQLRSLPMPDKGLAMLSDIYQPWKVKMQEKREFLLSNPGLEQDISNYLKVWKATKKYFEGAWQSKR